jgi:phosphate:Na+ symporter
MKEFTTLEVISIIIGVAGGLALFLYGMEQMTDALKSFAGSNMKKLLARMTSNRIKGVLTGIFVTGVIQSSSVTTVLTVGFISVGLLTLPQAVSIILGAHVGTTVTVQIIAFKINEFALLLVAGGFILKFIFKKDKFKYLGLMLIGFGLIFLGMNLMSEATYPLRSYEPFVNLMKQMANPLIGILVAAIFTAIVQSSSSTIGIVIALASQGFITLDAGIALVLGANVGTCFTAILASIGTPREGKQAALSHIIINISGVLIWLPFIPYLATIVEYISPAFHQLEGISKLAAESPRQIANAHTIFNVANTLIFLPFVTPLSKLIMWLLPLKPVTLAKELKPKYLDKTYLETPQLALDRVRMELGRQGKRVLRMLKEMPAAINAGDKEKLKIIKSMDNDVDAIHEFILEYLGKLSKEELTSEESNLMQTYLSSANYIENIGDVIETNLISQGKDIAKNNIQFSNEYLEIMQPLYDKINWAVSEAIKSIVENDKSIAQNIINVKPDVGNIRNMIFDYLSSRLYQDNGLSLAEFRLQSDIIENLMRIYYQAKRIAHVVTHIDSKESGQR